MKLVSISLRDSVYFNKSIPDTIYNILFATIGSGSKDCIVDCIT